MPDDDYLDDEQGGESEDSPAIRELRRKLRDSEKDAKEAQTLRTENALLKANLGGLSEKQRKAILATHDGELTPEALKATATDLGFIQAGDEAEAPQVTAEEQAAHQRAQEAISTAPASEAHPPSLEERIAAAKSPEELDQILTSAGELQTTE